MCSKYRTPLQYDCGGGGERPVLLSRTYVLAIMYTPGIHCTHRLYIVHSVYAV